MEDALSLAVRIRSLLEALLFAALILGALELVGWGHGHHVRGIGYGDMGQEKIQFLAQLPNAQLEDYQFDPQIVVGSISRELHPYFGFVTGQGTPGINNQGFRSEVDYPYRPGPGEFVVGVFGGSVAMQLAGDAASRERLEAGLLELLADRGIERVTLLSFANGGWRQPQTFNTFVYFVDFLDAAIILDGFNEITPLHRPDAKGWPVRFPWQEVFSQFAKPYTTPEDLMALGELTQLSHAAKAWTRLLQRPVLNRSAMAHAIWNARASRYSTRIHEIRKSLGNRDGDLDRFARLAPTNEREAQLQIDDYYALYTRLSRWQGLIARDRGMSLFHFIQPNQYVRDSKPFSDEELKRFVTRSAAWTDHVSASYETLDRVVAELAQAGIAAQNLQNVFRGQPETVYSDDCCHLRSVGLVTIADAMLLRIAESGALAEVTSLRPSKVASTGP